jgi:N-acetylglucosamine-6-sulfatase
MRLVATAAAILTTAMAAVNGTPATPTQAASGPSRPNIVVIETDDQTVESMRVMTNVNSLIASQGATFENSFVNYALCCPSRATFLTGQYMHNHGVLGSAPPDGGFGRFQALHGNDNLAVWLQDAGYYTAMIGKYLNGYASKPPVPPGWSEWQAAAPASGSTEADTLNAYSYTMDENGVSVHYGTSPTEFKQDVLTRKAVGLVNRRAPQAQPFFLWLTYTAPHTGGPNPNPNPPSDCGAAAKPAPRHAHVFDAEPLPRPPNFNEADVSDKPPWVRALPSLTASQITDLRRKYRCALESLMSVDEGTRRVVDALQARGELDDTLLIFTSDNGFFYGEHRIPGGKQRPYEESIRVPLLMRGPGIPQGVIVSDPAINVDLAPTIVDAAGAKAGLTMDGQSLIALAQRPGTGAGRDILIENRAFQDQPPFTAVRTDRYLYAEHATADKELYDLRRDPFELENRDGDRAYDSVEARLADRLHQLQTCSGSDCWAQR